MLRNGLEPWHLLVVAIVCIVLFGSKKLPDTARALGRSMRILKSEAQALKEDGAASRPTGETSSQVSGGVPAEPVVGRPEPVRTEAAAAEALADRREPVADR
ncbi:Sec-independent protein translocase subunit TatA [Streptomyces turgidiscabies]|uniref:Sec-independent protein translocase protein TatA n=1 Tax=Streptomyces turgidiscabies (strain Car8) TaxID=698760 RepID=L7F8N0_STRT8|nr:MULTISPECIES: Sec-independent protein translocase subunit TatA [Streptomyces]ELP67479.1 twin arginine-targeting protein translocase, TatA/E family [Streptomyces turgidiscabies Car8]MDX3495096.1 Sec-independent protein translocase subunit TatA [Streptomyces turgidiscabies]GAQ70969.1 twin arginine translocase protein A [Streptomyces turgidiscabies]